MVANTWLHLPALLVVVVDSPTYLRYPSITLGSKDAAFPLLKMLSWEVFAASKNRPQFALGFSIRTFIFPWRFS